MGVRPHTSYLICATPRSGSFLLCEALQNTGLAGNPDEILSRGFPDWEPTWDLRAYHDYVSDALEQGTGPNGVFGAKIMWATFNNMTGRLETLAQQQGTTVPALLSTIFPNLHYIWMTRNDKVRQVLSHYRAIKSGSWRRMAGGAPPPEEKVPPPPENTAIDTMVRGLAMSEANWQTFFYLSGITPLTVVYEDLVQAYEETALRVLRFLGITPPPDLTFKERRLLKQADAVTDEWVERYRAFKQGQPVR